MAHRWCGPDVVLTRRNTVLDWLNRPHYWRSRSVRLSNSLRCPIHRSTQRGAGCSAIADNKFDASHGRLCCGGCFRCVCHVEMCTSHFDHVRRCDVTRDTRYGATHSIGEPVARTIGRLSNGCSHRHDLPFCRTHSLLRTADAFTDSCPVDLRDSVGRRRDGVGSGTSPHSSMCRNLHWRDRGEICGGVHARHRVNDAGPKPWHFGALALSDDVDIGRLYAACRPACLSSFARWRGAAVRRCSPAAHSSLLGRYAAPWG